VGSWSQMPIGQYSKIPEVSEEERERLEEWCRELDERRVTPAHWTAQPILEDKSSIMGHSERKVPPPKKGRPTSKKVEPHGDVQRGPWCRADTRGVTGSARARGMVHASTLSPQGPARIVIPSTPPTQEKLEEGESGLEFVASVVRQGSNLGGSNLSQSLNDGFLAPHSSGIRKNLYFGAGAEKAKPGKHDPVSKRVKFSIPVDQIREFHAANGEICALKGKSVALSPKVT